MKGYDMVECKSENSVKYYFISPGLINVMKGIDFNFLDRTGNIEVFNLGFGDYDFGTGEIDDNSKTGNNDGRKVFSTVLNAIPKFFQYYPEKMLLIRSSDSTIQFKTNCQQTCKRMCGDKCRKFKQRLRIYRNYLNQNFKQLGIGYDFFGGFIDQNGIILFEPYIIEKEYDVILIKKLIK